jgi:hypothetical protein
MCRVSNYILNKKEGIMANTKSTEKEKGVEKLDIECPKKKKGKNKFKKIKERVRGLGRVGKRKKQKEKKS